MTMRRFSLIPHSRRKSTLIRSLCSFARYSNPAKPNFVRHGKSTSRSFHASSLSKAEEPNVEDDHYKFLGLSQDAGPEQIKFNFYKVRWSESVSTWLCSWKVTFSCRRSITLTVLLCRMRAISGRSSMRPTILLAIPINGQLTLRIASPPMNELFLIRREYDLTIKPPSRSSSWFQTSGQETDQFTRRKNYWANIERQQRAEWEAAGMPHGVSRQPFRHNVHQRFCRNPKDAPINANLAQGQVIGPG